MLNVREYQSWMSRSLGC